MKYNNKKGSFASTSARRKPSRGKQRIVNKRVIAPYGVELPGRPSA